MLSNRFIRITGATAEKLMKLVASPSSRSVCSLSPRIIRQNLQVPSTTPRISMRYKSDISDKLAESLSKEIDYEKNNEEVDQEFLDAKDIVEASFKVQTTPGSSFVTLTRNHGDEKIEVIFDVQDASEDDVVEGDEDEEPELSFGVNFRAVIHRGQQKLVVNAIAGQQINVLSLRMLKASQSIDDLEAYGGPEFDDLEEHLQEQILDYLEERKIDGDLSYFILAFAKDKEQKEYVHWLESFEDFVATK